MTSSSSGTTTAACPPSATHSGPEQEENGFLVQYFERARFEIHPELADFAAAPQPEIALGLLGQKGQLNLVYGGYLSRLRHGCLLQRHRSRNHRRLPRLLAKSRWRARLRLAHFPAVRMANPSDGNTYLTQWFQRARMEYHPELPQGHNIILGTLGTELYQSR